jgi:hypothetical protein
MTRRVLISFAVGIAAVILAPAASASITPALTLDQSGGTGAASTVNLGMDLKFAPSGGDSPKDLTISLPPGLLANASIDGGACLHAQAPIAACKVGGGTVAATAGGLPATGQVAFFLVAPPKPGDLAGLAQQVTLLGQTSQLGSPGEITVRPPSDPSGFGVNIAFTNIPDTYFTGLISVPISVQELNTTLNGVRMPASCPATPPNLAVTADSYSDPTSKTVTAPLHVTGCSALPFTPSLSATAVKDMADDGVQITTDVKQPASPAQATPKTVALSLDPKVLVANVPAILSDNLLCANPGSGTCTSVGTATSTSPLYPVPLNGTDYLTGTLTAPTLTIVFPPPFALTLVGSVATNNTTTFNNVPDIPLTDLRVTLTGGKDSAFMTSCDPASGIASATLTSAAGQAASTSTPFTVAGCKPPAGGSTGSTASPGGLPGLVSAAVSGLARGKPTLKFKLTAGKNAKLKSFTVKLPRGLSFRGRRVHHRLKLTGITLKGAKIKSIALRHGALVITLRKPVNTVSVKVGPRALKESAALKRAAKHHHLKRLQLTVVLKNTAGQTTTSKLPLKT